MKIMIDTSDFEFISMHISIPKNVICLQNAESIEVKGEEEDFELIIDALTEVMLDKGIDEEGEINFVGRKIEAIIDAITG